MSIYKTLDQIPLLTFTFWIAVNGLRFKVITQSITKKRAKNNALLRVARHVFPNDNTTISIKKLKEYEPIFRDSDPQWTNEVMV